MQHHIGGEEIFTATNTDHNAVCCGGRREHIRLHIDIGITVKATKFSSPHDFAAISPIYELEHILLGNGVDFIVVWRHGHRSNQWFADIRTPNLVKLSVQRDDMTDIIRDIDTAAICADSGCRPRSTLEGRFVHDLKI